MLASNRSKVCFWFFMATEPDQTPLAHDPLSSLYRIHLNQSPSLQGKRPFPRPPKTPFSPQIPTPKADPVIHRSLLNIRWSACPLEKDGSERPISSSIFLYCGFPIMLVPGQPRKPERLPQAVNAYSAPTSIKGGCQSPTKSSSPSKVCMILRSRCGLSSPIR